VAAGDDFRGCRALVTGGLGFIGSNLAIRLVESGAHVTVLDSLRPECGGNPENIEPIRDRLTVHGSDMLDLPSLLPIVRRQDFIFNLAGQVSHASSMRDPCLDLELNCRSTVHLLEACRRENPAARVAFASTRQVYGRSLSLPVTEDHPTLPVDANGIHKLASEHYYRLYHRVYGIRATVLRLTNTFGPRQKIASSGQGFAGYFIYRALRGEPIRLYGGGGQRRDFNYVDDVVAALLAAVSTEGCVGHVFNLGAPQACSLREFAEKLRALCDFDLLEVPFPADAQAIDIGDYYGDFSLFRDICGWTPQFGLEEALAATVHFYREHARAYDLWPART
jgi:nucleoside-diphosphate-sugar epimerase